MLLPVSIANATITGTPVLGAADKDATAPPPTMFHAVSSSISVIAGSDSVAPVATGCDAGACGVGAAPRFAVEFDAVTFSGAQFYLYMSTNGFANVNTTGSSPDINYAGPFSASDLLGTGKVVGNYWIGTAAAHELVVGPIPIKISTAYQYIKVYDGSCGVNPTFCGGTGIAGAKQLVLVQPGISITPVKGPAWTSVLVSGGGFQANVHVDINYTFTYYAWETGVGSLKHGQATTGIPTGMGWFSNWAFPMVDTGQAWNINAAGAPFNPTAITLFAVNSTKPHVLLTGAQNTVSPVVFNEFNRQFNQVTSYFSGANVWITPYELNSAAEGNATCEHVGANSGACQPAPKYSSLAGNYTLSPGYIEEQSVPVYVTGTLGIVGSNFTVSGSVTIWLGGINVGSFNASSTGHFVANVTVPKLPVGLNIAKAVANGVDYQFDIFVNPTLILSPNSGAIGSETGSTPTVSVTAFGFPANTWVSLWWFAHTSVSSTNYYLGNWTIDSTGSFNKSGGVSFVVPPEVNGGPHDVSAVNSAFAKYGPTVDEATIEPGVAGSFITETAFTVLPTISISPTSVSANQKGWFTVDGDGFDPSLPYYATIDNSLALSGAPGLIAGTNGDLIINFTSAGFRPGVHQIELYDWTTNLGSGSYAPTVWAYFNVTATGDFIGNAVASLQTSLTGIQTSLTAVQTSLTSVQSSLTSITSSLTSIQSSLTSISSTLSGISTTLGGVTSSLTGITSSLSQITSSLSTITGDVSGLGSSLTQLQSTVTSLQNTATQLQSSLSGLGTQLSGVTSSLSSMGTQLNTIQGYASTAATQSTAAATSAAQAVTGNQTAQTYVLVVAVLAAITLVLELAILVRKLS